MLMGRHSSNSERAMAEELQRAKLALDLQERDGLEAAASCRLAVKELIALHHAFDSALSGSD